MHFGSLYTETDYESTSHIFSASLNYQLTPKLNLMLQGNLSSSKASFDPIQMPDTDERREAEEIIHAADYDYSTVHTYSDLDYRFLNLRFGLNYKFSDTFGWNLDVDYYDLTDNQGYVYGVESGSFYVIRSGFMIYRPGS